MAATPASPISENGRHGAARRRALDPALDDERLLSFTDWCRLNSLSEDTGRRLLRSGQGPRVIRLSKRRLGISIADNRAWRAARERT
jgi:hypothetical protein